MAEFGEQIRAAREAKGITQQTLADQLNITRQTVSRWENGSRFPDIITTKKIAEILDVNVGTLISGERPKTIIEHSPVVDNALVNGLSIALFAGIAISYLISGIGDILRISSLSVSSLSDIWLIGVQAFCKLVGMVIFISGLFLSIKGELCPKENGLIVSIFWICNLLIDISKLPVSDSGTLGIIILLSIPSATGAITAFLFYFKGINAVYCRVLFYIASGWGIVRTMYIWGATFVYAYNYVSTETALSAVANICIYSLLIYQIYKVNRKRNLAASITSDLTNHSEV